MSINNDKTKMEAAEREGDEAKLRKVFMTSLRDVTSIIHGTVQLSCRLSAGTLRSSWFKDDVDISHSTRHAVVTIGNTTYLTIKDCGFHDAGLYTVKVDHEMGEVCSSCNVEVHDIYAFKTLVQENLAEAFHDEDELNALLHVMKNEEHLTWVRHAQLLQMNKSERIAKLIEYLQEFSTEECDIFLKLLHTGRLWDTIAFIFEPDTAKVRLSIQKEEVDQAGVDKWRGKGLSDKRILTKIEKIKATGKKKLKFYVLSEDLLSPLESKPSADIIKLPQINVVFMGKTGTGKSATANTLLGRMSFQESMSAASTAQCIAVDQTRIGSRIIKVIDMPGFLDTEREMEEVGLDMAKVFEECPEGIHVFLYVKQASATRCTKEEREVMAQVKEIFGEKVFDHTALILTHAAGSFKCKSLENYLDENTRETNNCNPFTVLVEAIQWHVLGVENKLDTCYERTLMRTCLVNMINRVLSDVNHEVYTHEYLIKHMSKTQAGLREEEVRQNKVKADFERFRNAYVRGKRRASSILKHRLSETNFDDIRKLQSDGIDSLEQELAQELLSNVSEEDKLLFHNLSMDHANPFKSIAIESVHEQLNVLSGLKAGNNVEHAKEQQPLLDLKRWIQTALAEKEAEITFKSEHYTRDVSWFVHKYHDVILQKLSVSKHSDDTKREKIEREIDYQIKVLINKVSYERLIDKIYQDFDVVSWSEIQQYVRSLTKKQLDNLTDVDYQILSERTRRRLSPESNRYLSSNYIDGIIRQRVREKYDDLRELAMYFACAIL